MTLYQLVVGGGVVWSIGLVLAIASAWPARRRRCSLSMEGLEHVVAPRVRVEPRATAPANDREPAPIPVRLPQAQAG